MSKKLVIAFALSLAILPIVAVTVFSDETTGSPDSTTTASTTGSDSTTSAAASAVDPSSTDATTVAANVVDPNTPTCSDSTGSGECDVTPGTPD